jgi:hypothetical protein
MNAMCAPHRPASLYSFESQPLSHKAETALAEIKRIREKLSCLWWWQGRSLRKDHDYWMRRFEAIRKQDFLDHVANKRKPQPAENPLPQPPLPDFGAILQQRRAERKGLRDANRGICVEEWPTKKEHIFVPGRRDDE